MTRDEFAIILIGVLVFAVFIALIVIMFSDVSGLRMKRKQERLKIEHLKMSDPKLYSLLYDEKGNSKVSGSSGRVRGGGAGLGYSCGICGGHVSGSCGHGQGSSGGHGGFGSGNGFGR